MATDHFINHLHARERTDWNFNILFEDQPQVAAYAEQYASLLEHPGLYEPVPGKWLHATVLRAGFIEDFSEAEMLETATVLEPKLATLKLPQLTLGNVFMWDGNPCLRITPDTDLQGVLKLIVRALSEVAGKDRVPQKTGFIPHITLAYSKTYDDEAAVHARLHSEQIADLPIRANSVSLIRQHVEHDYYVWEDVKGLPIGQAD
jgi:2'-5' RNA ligase